MSKTSRTETAADAPVPMTLCVTILLGVVATAVLMMSSCNLQAGATLEMPPAAKGQETAEGAPRYLPPVIGSGRAPRPADQPDPAVSDDETEIVVFLASWCKPSNYMEPIVERLIKEGYKVRKYDYENHRKIAEWYDLTGYPMFVFLVNGREVHRFAGWMKYTDLKALLTKHGIRPQR